METDRVHWPRIVLIYLTGVFAMMVVSAAVPALGGIAREFRPPSPATIGWVMSTPALAAALASLLVGALVDRVGDKPVMLGFSVLIIVGDAGVVTAGSMEALLAWRVVGGLGYVGVVVAAITMIARLTQGRARVAALALWSTVIPASFVLASLYGATVAHSAGWRTVFAVHAGGVLVLALLGQWLLPARPAGALAFSRLAGIGQVVRTRGPYLLGLSFAGGAFLQTGIVASLPAMLGRSIGAGEAQVHSFNIAAMLCNMAGAFAFGLLLNRGAKALTVCLAAVVLCAVAATGLVLAPTALGAAMAMNCALMFGLGLLVGTWALLPQVTPSPQTIGATSGLITQITLLGVLFGPPSAFAALHAGPTGTLIFAALALGIALIGAPVWARAREGGGPVAH